MKKIIEYREAAFHAPQLKGFKRQIRLLERAK